MSSSLKIRLLQDKINILAYLAVYKRSLIILDGFDLKSFACVFVNISISAIGAAFVSLASDH